MKFSLLVLSLVLATCYAQSHHVSWGSLSYNNTIVFSDYIEKESRYLQIVEERVTYPPKGVLSSRPITAIYAWDKNLKGNGANATIVAGGINNTSVTVRFVSQRGYSVKFNLEIFTSPPGYNC